MPVAHLLLGDAVPARSAVKVLLGAVVAVQLVGKVGAVDDAVADAVHLVVLAERRHTTWIMIFGLGNDS